MIDYFYTEVLFLFFILRSDAVFSAPSPRFSGHRDIIIDGFVPPSTSVAPMFPCFDNRFEWDDYGEVINPADYVIKEDYVDQSSMFVSTWISFF